MKVIVTGGRDYRNWEKLKQVLSSLQINHVIHGGAKGADSLASHYIDTESGGRITVYKAEWDLHGKAAGPIRNKKMLEENTDCIVIAFPGGRGTENCIEQAIKLGMIVLRVEE